MAIQKWQAGPSGTLGNTTGAEMAEGFNAILQKQVTAKPTTPQLYSPFGNSITASVNGFWQWFYTSQGGSITFLSNEGVGGDTTQKMLDRINNIPNNTTLCTVMEGTNDAGQGVTPLQHSINMKSILTTLIEKGITPIMLLAPPRDDITDTAAIRAMNLFDWVTCRELGVLCIDPFGQFSDGLGFYLPGLSIDGTHPNSATQKAAGLTISEMYNKFSSSYPFNTNNSTSEISNPLFMVDTNADGKPDSWSVNGGSNHTLAPTTLGVGNTFTFKALNNFSYIYNLFTLADNTKYSFACKVNVDFISRIDGKVEIYLQDPSGTRTYLMDEGFESTGDIVLTTEFTTEEEVGSWRFYVTANGTDYEVDISVAQVTIFSIDAHTMT